MLGGTEWLVIFFAVLLLFGGQKIPELMRGLGKGIREFNAARSNIEAELKEGMREAERKQEQERKLLDERAASTIPPVAADITDAVIEPKENA
jgi:sec-independent protein translocase protein TatA